MEANKSGYIWSSKAPYGAGVFFVAKKIEILILATDLCALNQFNVRI